MLLWRDDGALCGGNHRDRVLLAERLLDFLDRACFAESQACGIFGAEEDIYIRKNLLDAGSCLLAGPEIGTVVDIKRDQGSLLFEFADTFCALPPRPKVIPLVWNRRVL